MISCFPSRYLGTTPDSSSLAPLLTSICQQLSYTFMLPFEDIPDDLVPLTAHMKELLNQATESQPLMICLDSVDQLVGSQDGNKMSWMPTKLPPHCKIIVSCTRWLHSIPIRLNAPLWEDTRFSQDQLWPFFCKHKVQSLPFFVI